MVTKTTKKEFSKQVLATVLGSEIWSLILGFLVQDFPFLIVRLTIIIKFRLEKNYLVYYNFMKNFLLCSVEIYRIFIIFYREKKIGKLEKN